MAATMKPRTPSVLLSHQHHAPRFGVTRCCALNKPWAVLAGVLGGLARVIARRGAAAEWEGVTGEILPGVADV